MVRQAWIPVSADGIQRIEPIRPRRRGGGHRVLIIVQNLPVPLDRRVWQECQALTAAGYAVSVICPKGGPDDLPEERLQGVDIHRYHPPPAAHGLAGFVVEFLWCWLATARLALRIFRTRGFDALQACNPPDTYWALAWLFKPFGARFVYDQHDLCPELYEARFARPSRLVGRALRLLERATYATADHVIGTNATFRRTAIERGRLSPENVSIVRSAPLATRMRAGEPDPTVRHGRRHLVAYLGVMGPQDGVDVLIDATAELVHRRGRTDVHVALMGFGDEMDRLRRQAAEAHVEPYVTFTGRVGDEQISRYLSTADIGVAPDPPNEFNDRISMNKLVEYMAFGLPVVSFDLRETRISTGDAGELATSPTAEGLADAIERLLDDPIRRMQLGAMGRRRVEDGLCWEVQSQRYVRVYDQLLGVPPARVSGEADPAVHVVQLEPTRDQLEPTRDADEPTVAPVRS